MQKNNNLPFHPMQTWDGSNPPCSERLPGVFSVAWHYPLTGSVDPPPLRSHYHVTLSYFPAQWRSSSWIFALLN